MCEICSSLLGWECKWGEQRFPLTLGITTVSGKGSLGMRCWMGNHRGGVGRVSSLNSREKAGRLKCKEHVALTWKKYPYVFQGGYNLLVEGSKTQQGSVPEPPLHFHVPFLPSSTPTILGIQGPHNPPPCNLLSAMLTSSHQCSPAASSVARQL